MVLTYPTNKGNMRVYERSRIRGLQVFSQGANGGRQFYSLAHPSCNCWQLLRRCHVVSTLPNIAGAIDRQLTKWIRQSVFCTYRAYQNQAAKHAGERIRKCFSQQTYIHYSSGKRSQGIISWTHRYCPS